MVLGRPGPTSIHPPSGGQATGHARGGRGGGGAAARGAGSPGAAVRAADPRPLPVVGSRRGAGREVGWL